MRSKPAAERAFSFLRLEIPLYPNMRAAIAASVLLSAAVSAAVTGEWQVNLVRGSTTVQPPSVGATEAEAWAACQARIPSTAAAKTAYKCQTPRYVAVVTPDQVPTCPPLPSPETRTQQCPAGTTGTWTQTRTYSAVAYPTCSIAGEWLPTEPPSGACTVIPPSGDTIRNGELFNIVGSGFGTKPRAAPAVFDDFENGTGRVEGKPAAVGTWGRGDWSYAITYNATQPLQGAKVAHHAFNSSDYNASLYVDPPSVPAVYMDFWMRVVPKSSALTRNFKPWRVYGQNDASTANDVIFCDSPGWVGLESGGGAWVQRARVWNAWEHYRIAIKFGANGLFSQHRDGIADVVRTGITAGGSPQGVRIGHYWATSADANCPANPGADVYTDLVYVDTSLARVYLADAPTLAQAKHTAIQIPTAWADGQVTIRANTHGFARGSSAHLIVVTAANAERPAQRVTVQ